MLQGGGWEEPRGLTFRENSARRPARSLSNLQPFRNPPVVASPRVVSLPIGGVSNFSGSERSNLIALLLQDGIEQSQNLGYEGLVAIADPTQNLLIGILHTFCSDRRRVVNSQRRTQCGLEINHTPLSHTSHQL